jgi:hypothetical protein
MVWLFYIMTQRLPGAGITDNKVHDGFFLTVNRG